MAKLVLILGMHRAGTSFISHLLNKLDIDLGQDLVEGNAHNQDGFFENKYIVSQNKLIEQIIDRYHAQPSGMLSTPDGWQHWKEVIPIKQNLRSYIIDHLSRSTTDYWGFKDPRTMRCLALYNDILVEERISVQAVLCLRQPESIIRSLINRNKMSKNVVELILIRHYYEMLNHLDNFGTTIIRYENVFEHPEQTLAHLSEQFSYNGDREAILTFIDQCNNKYRPLDKCLQDREKIQCSMLAQDLHKYFSSEAKTEEGRQQITEKLRYVFEATAGYEDYFGSINELGDKIYTSGRETEKLKGRLSQQADMNNQLRKDLKQAQTALEKIKQNSLFRLRGGIKRLTGI